MDELVGNSFRRGDRYGDMDGVCGLRGLSCCENEEYLSNPNSASKSLRMSLMNCVMTF